MARYTGAVCKLCRREGAKLFLKGERCFAKCPVDKPTGTLIPGQHSKRRRKITEYGKRLREKQKTKRIAGLLERSFYGYFNRARHVKGETGLSLLKLLEIRLDNVVRRLGLAPSMASARQLVSHGHIRVNGRGVDIPSYSVKPGDVITLDDKLKANLWVQRSISNQMRRDYPSWLELNADLVQTLGRSKDLPIDLGSVKVEGHMRVMPNREELSYPVNEQFIVELYSK